MTDVFIGLGSNTGPREQMLHRAAELLQERIGETVRLSAFYETAPWGFDSPHAFLNAAILLRTPLSPGELLTATRRIERELGRTRKSTDGGYADRCIDIDILLYGDLVEETDVEAPDGVFHLSLPHPLMHRRLFVMEPLAEIAPHVLHPVLHKTFANLRDALQTT